jgi:succinate dehydrogenase / fumarate reductase cytochrome b subunit
MSEERRCSTVQRPKFLCLWQIRLPLPGIVSILHRISGAALFFLLPFLIYLLDLSLASPEDFSRFLRYWDCWPVKLLLLGLLWAYLHHFFAGLRYLMLDLQWGLALPCARRSARLVLIVSLGLTLILGVKLW